MVYKKNFEKREERDYQQEITDKYIKRIEEIIENEEKGLKWEKPFFTCSEWPVNGVTGEKYRGGNVVNLISEEQSDPRWATFNQIQDLAKQLDKPLKIIKGSKASHIMKVVPSYQKDDSGNVLKDGEGNPVPVFGEDGKPKIGFKWYPVFNFSQVEGIEPYLKPNKEVKPFETVELLSKALQERTGLTVEHSKRTEAFYSSAKHLVHMPEPQYFKSSEAYADTFLHEAGHSTGPALGRKMGNGFGSEDYAKEELVAELSSAYMAMELGIPHNPNSHENHILYMKSWLGVLKDDKTFIMKASAQASKATEYQIDHINAYKQDLVKREELAKELTGAIIDRTSKTTKATMTM